MSSVGVPINSVSPGMGLSIAALALGFLSLFLGVLVAVPGIILGHVAYARTKENPYRFGGARLAVTGLSLCYFMCLMSVIALIYLMGHPHLMHQLADYLGYSLVLADGA